MPTERENSLPVITLTPADYEIAGNHIRAYYDARHKLVFVIDYTINDMKPNVLLVLNSVGNRKWDDVLANDYGIDLETVRPKKDNKYQKLDIEYGGLGAYDALINAFDANDNLDVALAALADFRTESVRRSASERFDAAQIMATNARETIVKTNETISELQARLRDLRLKLRDLRKNVGREPTKQSAAKILRAEAQIDATNEKLRRAKKRLISAQRRLVSVEEDAAAALDILNKNPGELPLMADNAGNDLMVVNDSLPAEIAPKFTEIVTFESNKGDLAPINEPISEQKAEDMADEEVKPLFDKDPEILDEEIAFKPIDFNMPAVALDNAPAVRSAPGVVAVTPGEEIVESIVADEPVAPMPLSFVPPTSRRDASDSVAPTAEHASPAPVLDTITSVDVPSDNTDVIVETFTPAPVAPDVAAVPESAPMPEISPAPAMSNLRPVSPITGGAPTGVAIGGATQKPTLLYYIMLIVLIVLSIFTLWIYQKSANDNVPDLAPAVKEPVVEEASNPEPAQSDDFANPFIEAVATNAPAANNDVVQNVSIEVEDITPAAPEMDIPAVNEVPDAPNPEPEPEIAPVMTEPEPVAMPEITEDTETEPVMTQEMAAVETVAAEPVVNKPAYNVSQQENMFVASSDYETDNDDDSMTCSDGGMPDAFGCCGGETFTDMGDGTGACCAGDECYPPMF